MKGQCRTLMAATHCHSWWMWWWSSGTFKEVLLLLFNCGMLEVQRVANDLHVAAPWNTKDLTQVLKSLLLMQADEQQLVEECLTTRCTWHFTLAHWRMWPGACSQEMQHNPILRTAKDSSAGSSLVNHLVSEQLMLQLSLENHLRTALHLGSSIHPL